jgi:hypothetical protein
LPARNSNHGRHVSSREKEQELYQAGLFTKKITETVELFRMYVVNIPTAFVLVVYVLIGYYLSTRSLGGRHNF